MSELQRACRVECWCLTPLLRGLCAQRARAIIIPRARLLRAQPQRVAPPPELETVLEPAPREHLRRCAHPTRIAPAAGGKVWATSQKSPWPLRATHTPLIAPAAGARAIAQYGPETRPLTGSRCMRPSGSMDEVAASLKLAGSRVCAPVFMQMCPIGVCAARRLLGCCFLRPAVEPAVLLCAARLV